MNNELRTLLIMMGRLYYLPNSLYFCIFVFKGFLFQKLRHLSLLVVFHVF